MNEKILIVEPDKKWRERLSSILSDLEVVQRSSLDEALKDISKHDFHVIVTEISFDVIENDEKGLRLIEQIRNQNDWTEIIIVAKSDNSPLRILVELREFGVDLDRLSSKDASEKEDQPFIDEDFRDKVLFAMEVAKTHRFMHDVFVIMPFEGYESTYKYIETASGAINLTCKRADEPLQQSSNEIMQDIDYGITHTRVVVAELSGANPNVFFEVGISKAKKKPIISIARGQKYLTKMLANWRAILYEASFDGAGKLSDGLKKRLPHEIKKKTGMQRNDKAELYVFVVTPETESGRDTYDDIILPILKEFSLEDKYLWEIVAKKNFPKEVEEHLRKAALVIVDLSKEDDMEASFDPDAFYMAGLTYSANKKYIFLFDKAQIPPFDIAALSLLRYAKRTRTDREKARNALKQRLARIYKKWDRHILFLSANPQNTQRLSLDKEFSKIKKLVEDSKNLTLELPELALHPEDLSATLLRHSEKKAPLIIHFSGHGSNKGELLLEDERDDALPAAPHILVDLFKKFSGHIQCVILNACYSEKSAEAIAPHIEYVIGTRNSISDKAAIGFSGGFYQALVAGESIEEAFKNGRIGSGFENAIEYDTPVLWIKGEKQ